MRPMQKLLYVSVYFTFNDGNSLFRSSPSPTSGLQTLSQEFGIC
ncbi:hypothetical protein COMNV_00717 [Commensalibacter sp. Nvir]|nr:hypothetical protein COMNV_00717 [Commensalibacter sp. Nvir]